MFDHEYLLPRRPFHHTRLPNVFTFTGQQAVSHRYPHCQAHLHVRPRSCAGNHRHRGGGGKGVGKGVALPQRPAAADDRYRAAGGEDLWKGKTREEHSNSEGEDMEARTVCMFSCASSNAAENRCEKLQKNSFSSSEIVGAASMFSAHGAPWTCEISRFPELAITTIIGLLVITNILGTSKKDINREKIN